MRTLAARMGNLGPLIYIDLSCSLPSSPLSNLYACGSSSAPSARLSLTSASYQGLDASEFPLQLASLRIHHLSKNGSLHRCSSRSCPFGHRPRRASQQAHRSGHFRLHCAMGEGLCTYLLHTVTESTISPLHSQLAAGGGEKCNPVSVTAFTTLLAAAGPCEQQNSADAMIDLAKTLNNDADMIKFAQIFAQQPRNTVSSHSPLIVPQRSII